MKTRLPFAITSLAATAVLLLTCTWLVSAQIPRPAATSASDPSASIARSLTLRQEDHTARGGTSELLVEGHLLILDAKSPLGQLNWRARLGERPGV